LQSEISSSGKGAKNTPKICPERQKKKKKIPDLTKRGKSNFLAQGSFIRVLTVFICIDALDECLPKHLPELLGSLRDIVRESPTTRIFLTGRPYVKGAIQKYFAGAVVIPISPNVDDIRNYLEMKLDRDDDPEAMDNELRVDIVEGVLNKMSDMCVGAFGLPIILVMYTYKQLYVDSSLFR